MKMGDIGNLVTDHRTTGAGRRIGGAQHVVVDNQLLSPAEQVTKREITFDAFESIGSVHLLPAAPKVSGGALQPACHAPP